MIRATALALLVALPWPLDTVVSEMVPDWVDQALYNPRERTDAAIEAAAEGDDEAALRAARKAYKIAPRHLPEDVPEGAEADAEGSPPEPRVDARVAYNAGTAHLAAGQERRAVDLLTEAAEGADREAPELAPTAWYNLGNAQLGAGDTAAAVASFKQSLRRDPADAAAKHNLEVALRRLEEERKLPLKRPQETPGAENPGDEESGDGGGGTGEEERRDDEQPQDADRTNQDGSARGETEREGGADEARPRPGSALQDFEDQPDMTAEQARALLEAVENVERRQRQEEAARLQRRQAAGRKDW